MQFNSFKEAEQWFKEAKVCITCKYGNVKCHNILSNNYNNEVVCTDTCNHWAEDDNDYLKYYVDNIIPSIRIILKDTNNSTLYDGSANNINKDYRNNYVVLEDHPYENANEYIIKEVNKGD